MTNTKIIWLKLVRLYKSFRIKVLMSFFAFGAIILIWVFTYFLIQEKQGKMQAFKTNLANVQNSFLENNRNLEYFILIGFRSADFYNTKKQHHIDKFLEEQRNEIKYLEELENDARKKKVHVTSEIDTIIRLNSLLLDSVIELRNIYFIKGYKYYGTEGKIRELAHYLEDSTTIEKTDILQLRRKEKDYMLRGDQKYVEESNRLTEKLLLQFKPGSKSYIVVADYRSYFNRLIAYNERLGIYTNNGLYENVQNNINLVELQFKIAKSKADTEVSIIQHFFHNLLIGISVLLIIAAILLSYYRSNFLTKDIKKLNKKINSFIRSRFKDDVQSDMYFVNSKITEINKLNRNYMHLKKTLKNSLAHLENAVTEEKKSSEYKSSFVANISHEIRTPLTGIIGMIHLLKETPLTEEQVDMLETLDFSAHHLGELINMVLDYSKIEAGKMDLEEIPFDLHGDIKKLVKLFEYKVVEKGLRLSLDYRIDASYYIIGDPLRLQQVVMNLLNNAIKFTATGGIELRIIPIIINERYHQVRFEVEDTGIGIANNEIDKLFKAFNQANSSISRNFGGTGLGLTISNQIIKLMGGQLSVSSEPGKGSVFSFELKFKTGELLKTHKRETELAAPPALEKLKILLAEDNLINQKVISRMLQKHDAEVLFANNGMEAVDLYIQRDFDLIFMDIQMPDMDGLEATKVICNSERYKTNHPPIVAFSANAYSTDRKIARDAGMDDFLSKPVKPEELDAIIVKYSTRRAAV